MNSTKNLFERIIREECQQVKLNEQTKLKAPTASSTAVVNTPKPKKNLGAQLTSNVLNNSKNLQKILDKLPGVRKNSVGEPPTISYEFNVKWLNLPVSWQNNVNDKITSWNPSQKIWDQLSRHTTQRWTIYPNDGICIANVGGSTYKYNVSANVAANKIYIKTLTGTEVYQLTNLAAFDYLYKGNKFFNDIDALLWTTNGRELSDIEKASTTTPAQTRESIHKWLDVIGFVPVIGSVADFTNALIYFSEGRNFEAFLSLIAVNPLLDVAKVGARAVVRSLELGPNAIKALPKTDDAAELIKWWQEYGSKADPDVMLTLSKNMSKRKKIIRDILNKTPDDKFVEVYDQLMKLEKEILNKIEIPTSPGASKFTKIDLPTFFKKIGATTPVTKAGVTAILKSAADLATAAPLISLVPKPVWAKLLGLLEPAGTFYKGFLEKNLSNMFNRKFSDPKFWETLGTPILGDTFKQLRKQARNSFKAAPDGAEAWKIFSERHNIVQDLRKQIDELQTQLKKPTAGFQTTSKQAELNSVKQKIQDLQNTLTTANNNRRMAWDYFDDRFVNSKVYEKVLGQNVANELSKTKIAEAFAENMANRLIAALHPKYMANSGGEFLKTMGKEFTKNIFTARQYFDLAYNEIADVSAEINRRANNPDLIDSEAAKEAWLYDMIRDKNGDVKKTNNSVANFMIDKINTYIAEKAELLRDTTRMLQFTDSNKTGGESDLAK
jgi:hypothetical protein